MNTLRLALRLLARDWRAGELRVLIAAMILAGGGGGTVGVFAGRGKLALARHADTRLAQRLGATLGTKLAVGEATLTVSAIIAQEPEIAGLSFALGPKLLLNLDEVPATRLLQPGNRATWRLLVAESNGRAVDAYRQWATAELGPGQRIDTVRDLRPEVRQTLDRAEKFLGLAALVAVLLAAGAVALASPPYLRRHLP